MNDKTGGTAPDELMVAAQIKAHVSGLDQYTPAPPPFARIEGRLRAGRVNWGDGRESRTENRAGRLRRPFGAALTVVVIMLAAALVLGPGIWLSTVGPAVTGATPSASVDTAAPSPRASATVGPTVTPVVSPGRLSQKTILDSGTQQVLAVSWSPGGTNIAVTLGNSGQSWHVQILRSDGTPVETVQTGELAWIDDETYVGLDCSAVTGDSGGRAFVGHVGSSALSYLPGTYACGLLGGSAGVVALMTDAKFTSYAIWTPSGLSAPRSGEPIVFSPDGTLLAVVHDPTPCCGGAPVATGPVPEATLDIVRTSTGESVARAGMVAWAYGTTIIFSPDGKRVAYLMRMPERPSAEGFAILDIASGTVSVLDAGLGKVFGWMAKDRLLVASRAPGAPAPKGLQVTALDTAVDTVAVSSTGRIASALAGDQATQSRTLTLEFGAGRETFELPGYPGVLAWSPDGSTLLAACNTPSMQPPDQVVLITP
jgi:hypothetical protein